LANSLIPRASHLFVESATSAPSNNSGGGCLRSVIPTFKNFFWISTPHLRRVCRNGPRNHGDFRRLLISGSKVRVLVRPPNYLTISIGNTKANNKFPRAKFSGPWRTRGAVNEPAGCGDDKYVVGKSMVMPFVPARVCARCRLPVLAKTKRASLQRSQADFQVSGSTPSTRRLRCPTDSDKCSVAVPSFYPEKVDRTQTGCSSDTPIRAGTGTAVRATRLRVRQRTTGPRSTRRTFRCCPKYPPAAAAARPWLSADRAHLHFARSKHHWFAGLN
jgi:hypothetical protein